MIETLLNTCGCAVKVKTYSFISPLPGCDGKVNVTVSVTLDSIDYCHVHRARPGYKDGQVPHCGVDTSREAAQAIRPVLKKLEATVLFAAEEAGDKGLTVEDCEIQLYMAFPGRWSHPRDCRLTAGARLTTLTDRGYLVKTEERRMLSSGNPGRVWKLSDHIGERTEKVADPIPTPGCGEEEGR